MKMLHKVLAVVLFGAMVAPVQSAAVAGKKVVKKQQGGKKHRGGYKTASGKKTEAKQDKKS